MKRITRILAAFYLLLSSSVGLLPFAAPAAGADSTNLIANASVETTASATTPQDWSTDHWGTNTASFSYATTGRTGTRSLTAQITAYTSGDAKWYFTPVAVTSGSTYTYSDYYQATATTSVVARFDNGTGSYTYRDLGTAAASSTWKQYSANITIPANTTNLTILHVIAGVGTLTTDDYSLTAAAVVTPPTTGNLITNPSFETADPNNSATPQGWLQDSWGTNTPTFSYASTGHTGTRSGKVQLTSYTSGDAKWYFTPVAVSSSTAYTFSDYYQSTIATQVVAQLEDAAGNDTYVSLGTAAASTTWKQFSGTVTTTATTKNVTILHVIAGVGTLTTDDYSLTKTTAATTAPLVSITAPAASSTVQGTVSITGTATAQGGNAISSVQFLVDGTPVGAADTTSPYSASWATTTVADGTHQLTAKVVAADGQTATSAAVSVTVKNTTTTVPTNLVPNASVETASATDPTLPAQWYKGSWGTNTATFSYASTGHLSDHGVKVTMSNFVDGGANWTYDAPVVEPGKVYTFSNYYQSNTQTQIIAAVLLTDGTTQYVWLGNPFVSDGAWTKFSTTFTMPANAVTAVVYQTIAANGYFIADDFDLEPYAPKGFSAPMVTVTFDDSIRTQYTNALPVLNKYGLHATFYAISGDIGVCDPNVSSICYMTKTQLKALQTAGNEIGSHTVTHPDLTTLTLAQVTTELSKSQTDLQTWLGVPVTNLAAPYGAVNESVLGIAKNYYVSHRGVEIGYNSIDNYDQMNLLVQDINSTTSVADVEGYIDHAKATNTWLILMYHDINTDPSVDPGYNTTPADFKTQMAYLSASGVAVKTMAQALAIVAPQVK